MAKRFTDTKKWKDPWFVDLPCVSKVLFLYLCDNCDMAGFLERHDRSIEFFTGIKQAEIPSAFSLLEKSVVLRERWIWVKNFIKHQKNLPLNPRNNAHLSALNSLFDKSFIFNDLYQENIGLSSEEIRGLLGANEGLPSPIGKGKGKGKERIVKENKIPNQKDCLEYFKELGSSNGEFEKFFDYFQSNGWKVGGKSPMRDWKAAARNWIRRANPKHEHAKKRPPEYCEGCHGSGRLPDGKKCWCH